VWHETNKELPKRHESKRERADSKRSKLCSDSKKSMCARPRRSSRKSECPRLWTDKEESGSAKSNTKRVNPSRETPMTNKEGPARAKLFKKISKSMRE
jgi:hypothetical protein